MGQKALIDPQLDSLIRQLAQQKHHASILRTVNHAVPWLRPKLDDSTWEGDLQSEAALIEMHEPFNTDKAEQALIDTCNPTDPGNSADGIVLSLQIDYAAQAERAFRARTTHNFARSVAHLAARERGHGQPTGALIGQALDYFTHIIKQGSSAPSGS